MWRFNGSNGNATATGSWVPTSDERLKNLHGPITDPLAKMQQIRGQTWNMKEGGGFGVGFTAQDVQRVFPDSVHSTGDKTLSDGTVVKDVLAPDTYGVAAGLHHEAILALLKRIEVLETKLKDK
ncbi:tail fiber domain-containing protein [Enterobacter cloacae]|nr:tail fiber domain-containing protein [Enterobacter cloacae]HDC4264214.1 tail fiber domain-containing protein [Enterobacter cloacae]